MKRTIGLLLALAMIVSLAGGCAGSESSPGAAATSAGENSSGSADTSSASGGTVSKDFTDLNAQVAKLSGKDAYDFFEGLAGRGLTQQEILAFFVQLPLSKANSQIYDLYTKEGLDHYDEPFLTYDRYKTVDGFSLDPANLKGNKIVGPISRQNLNLPFSTYVPYTKDTVGDPNRTYTIGVVLGTSQIPWSINLCDAGVWQLKQIKNVKINYQEASTADEQTSVMDAFIAQKVDAIIFNPTYMAASIASADKAGAAGIPVFTVDTVCESDAITGRLAGNHDVAGVMCALALLNKLNSEGSFSANMVLVRQYLGMSTDCLRIGHLLKVLTYFPDIKILGSYHDQFSRTEALQAMDAAFQSFPAPDIDIIVGGSGDEDAAIYQSTIANKRMYSRKDGKQLIITCINDAKDILRYLKDDGVLCVAPSSPLNADVISRVCLKYLDGEKGLKDVLIPAEPLVTKDGKPLFGIKTCTVDQWYDYGYGE